MPYNNRNHILKRRHALRVTEQYYEPGRQDRCRRWVWQKYIRDQFHVEYKTYLQWLRDERRTPATSQQLSLFD